MKILNTAKSGSSQMILGVEIKQYDDSITVEFDSYEEMDQNRIINHENVNYYHGCSNKTKENKYIAKYWKTKPVY